MDGAALEVRGTWLWVRWFSSIEGDPQVVAGVCEVSAPRVVEVGKMRAWEGCVGGAPRQPPLINCFPGCGSPSWPPPCLVSPLPSYIYVLCAQSCLTLCDPMDCSPPGSFAHGIFQVRILEWVAVSYFRGSSQPRDRTGVSCISSLAGGFFIVHTPCLPC